MFKTSKSKDSEISLKQVLDAIQKQNEIHARTTTEIQRQIQILTKQVSEENQRLAKKIELVRQSVAEVKLGIGSQETIMTKDFETLTNSTKETAKSRNRVRVPVTSAPETIFDPESDNDDEYQDYNQPGQSNINKILRSTLKTKLIQNKSEIINKQKAPENVENKLTKEEQRGIKRKSISDNESETTNARQRRKVLLTDTASDSDRCKSVGVKSVENDNAITSVIAIDEANLSQRTRSEISRLRINMLFNSPLSCSRRSKSCDDKKQPEENKGANIAKREAKHRGRPRRWDKVEVKKGEDTRKILQNKKSGLEEQRTVEENTKEETAETEVNSKSISNNKCDLLNTERAIEINDTVQNIKFTEGRSQTQNDMEDVVEESQALCKLDKSKLLRIRIGPNKIENTKTILQNKKNSLEGEKEAGEKKHEENVQIEITSKSISDDKCDLIYIKKKNKKKSIENNVEVVNNKKSYSETQSLNQDLKSIEEKNQTQDDAEDTVKGSQETLELLKKKCIEKQCFIKINKVDDISPLMKYYDVIS